MRRWGCAVDELEAMEALDSADNVTVREVRNELAECVREYRQTITDL